MSLFQHICFLLLSLQLLLRIQQKLLLTRHWRHNVIPTALTTALTTYTYPLNTCIHFVDDGIGDFLNFLNSLTNDLQYTIEYPSEDGSLLYMDILIHSDHTYKVTSVYRKQTHTNLHVRYNSCTSSSSKDSVIRSLTRLTHILCSPNTYKLNWTRSTPTPYKNGHP